MALNRTIGYKIMVCSACDRLRAPHLPNGCKCGPTQENIMALSKQGAAAKTALTKVAAQQGGLTFEDKVKQLLRHLATRLSDDTLAPAQLTVTYNAIKDWADNLDALKDAAAKRLKAIVAKWGAVVGEAGSKRAIVDGWVLEIRPGGKVWDTKKISALLTGKKLDLGKWMVETREYKVDETKLGVLVELGKLTQAEVDACRAERSYSLQPPHLLAEDDECDL